MLREQRELYNQKSLFPIIKAKEKAPIENWRDPNRHRWNFDGIEMHDCFALITGSKSGIWVLDLDVKHRSLNEVYNDLIAITNMTKEEQRILDSTFSVRTPSGGMHYYFKQRGDLKNTQGDIPDIDTRATGGVVIAPYSTRKDGIYEPIDKERPILDMPDSLYKFYSNDDKKKPVHSKTNSDKSKGKVVNFKDNNSIKNYTGNPRNTINAIDYLRLNVKRAVNANDPFKQLRGMKDGDGRNEALYKWLFATCARNGIRDHQEILDIAELVNTEVFAEPEPGAYRTAESVYESLIYIPIAPLNASGKGITREEIAGLKQLIKATNHIKVGTQTHSNITLLYWYINGAYKRLNEKMVKAIIKEYIPPLQQHSYIPEEIYKQLETDLDNMINVDSLDSDERYINFKNGLYNIQTKQLEPHSPKVLSTIQINGNYHNEKIPTPIFDKFMDDFTEGDQEVRDMLQEYVGATISNLNMGAVKKALVLYGAVGNSGKSVFLNVVTNLLGSINYASRSLQDFSKNFAIADLYGKRANIVDDMNTADFNDTRGFKSLTGDGVVNVEFKGKQSFTWRFKGTMLIATNELPYIKDEKGTHFFERLIIYECKNSLKKEDRDSRLFQKLKDETDGIIQWAIEGLHRFIAQGRKFTIPKCTEVTSEEYREQSDTVYRFVKDQFEITGNPDDRIPTSWFHELYARWAFDEGITYPSSPQGVKKRLKQMNVGTIKTNGIHNYICVKRSNS